MYRKLMLLILISSLAVTNLVSQNISSQFLSSTQVSTSQSEGVHNLDSHLNYTTIQEAIDAPETLDGHTILVDAGSYYENVVLDKALTLTGESRSNTIINGDGLNYTGALVTIVADNVDMSGFTVTNALHQGIEVEERQYCEVHDNIVCFTGDRGIVFGSGDNNKAYNNVVHNSSAYGGIEAIYSNNNTIYNNTAYFNQWGIATNHGSYNHIYNNKVHSNRGVGIHIDWPSTDNIIYDNDISSNTNDGIRVINQANRTEIFGNKISENYCGIFLHSYANNISGNYIANNDYGVWLDSSSNNNTVSGNNITNNDYGVQLDWSSGNTFSGNNITNNDYGVQLDWSSGNTFSGNNITNNIKYGIEFQHSSYNTIFRNTITANNGTGASINDGSNNSVFNNTIFDNYIGFSVQYSHNNTLSSNHMANNTYNFAIYSNTLSDFLQDIDSSNTVDEKPMYYWVDEENLEIPGDGGYVALINSRNITVQDLNLTHNSHGVLLAYTTNSTVKNVTTEFNGIGIGLQSSYNNTLIGNVASNNTQYGIALSDSGGNVLRNNTMTDNAIINFGVIPSPGLIPTPSTFINDVDPSNKVDGKPIYYWVNQSNRHVPSDAGCVLIVNSTDITVSNLTLTDNVFGVGLIYSTNSLVRNVTVQNNMMGFSVLFSNTTTIANNTIGDNSHGIVLAYSHYNKVLRNSIKNNENGIYLQYSNSNMLTRNNVTHNIFGIQLDYSDRNELTWNRVANNTEGIRLQKSYANILTLNNITANINSGLDLANSGSNTLRNNSLTDNQWNFGIWGDALSDFINDVDTSNTVNNNTIVYLVNQTNLTVDPSTFSQVGCLVVVNSTNINVQSLTLTDNYETLTFAYTSDSTITNITATNNFVSILLWNAKNNTVTNNILRDNMLGPTIYNSNDNRLINNAITNNNYRGIGLYSDSHNNTLIGNVVKNSSYGVYLDMSEENTFYHNNFFDNTNQVYIEKSPNNTWDNGVEGNYWSDYCGFDSEPDGIGDDWYEMGENNTDHYPLMGMFSDFNTSLGYPVDVISNSTIEDFEHFDSTIRLRVSNITTNQTRGFCRITIPHDVMSPPYNVTINDNPMAHTTVYENETLGLSIIYFSYEHSTLEITIVPEFPSMLILPLFTIATLLAAMIHRRKHTR